MENLNSNTDTGSSTQQIQTGSTPDSQWPTRKKNKNTVKVVVSILGLVTVIGVAVGSYFVSAKVSSKQAIAPNAPSSQPYAKGPALCNDGNKDNPFPLTMTFSKTGKVLVYSSGFSGHISVRGPASYDLYSNSDGYTQVGSFNVTAGQTYSFNSQHNAESGPGVGWRPMWNGTHCGPQTLATPPGQQVENGCGTVIDIGGFKSFAAATSDISGITSGGGSANVQCWGDAHTGDWPSEYDYNDWQLAFGYEKCTTNGTITCTPDCPTACGKPASTITTCKDSCNVNATKQCPATAECPVAGVCSEVLIFRIQSDGTLGENPTPLTQTQLATLRIGDKLSIQAQGSKANLRARFRITLNNNIEAPEWKDAVGYVDPQKKISFIVYEIKSLGAYKFEAQVSSKP